ncbi:MAG: hypothetical protein KAQ68_05415 [Clostridiales bacterium]|nr:hypothetical protein [Clostridiales bacterium]
MRQFAPKNLFIIGGILVGLGFIVPFLMVMKVVPMWLWLEMIVALLQIFGLVLGIVGSVMYVKEKRDGKDKY